VILEMRQKIRAFQKHLKEELKDPEFRKRFDDERNKLALARKKLAHNLRKRGIRTLRAVEQLIDESRS